MLFGFGSDLGYDLFILIRREQVGHFSRVEHVVYVFEKFFNYNLKVKIKESMFSLCPFGSYSESVDKPVCR